MDAFLSLEESADIDFLVQKKPEKQGYLLSVPVFGFGFLLFVPPAWAGELTLAWNESGQPQVVGYRLHYGTTSRIYDSRVDVGDQTAYRLAGLSEGQTYYFAVTAYDAQANESGFSNEVRATISDSDDDDDDDNDIGNGSADANDNNNGSDSGGVTKSGLVAAYTFEEPSGSQVQDLTGNGNTGVISGATRISQGIFGKALSFDGIDDWVTVDNYPSLDLIDGMTLEAWVYPGAPFYGWHTVVVKEFSDNASYGLYANTHWNQAATAVYANNQRFLHAGSKLAERQWTHLASTYDGSIQRLYVNGAEVANQPLYGAIVPSNGNFRIGGNSYWGDYFNGYIDEVRIYNRALSADEIRQNMNATLTVQASSFALETGELTVNGQWQRVTFDQTFDDPVVIAKPLSFLMAEPATVRIRNVNSSSFDIAVEEWDYMEGVDIVGDVGYLVMERGSYTLEDGTRIEAGRVDTNSTGAFTAVGFAQPFNKAPVVLASVITNRDADTVVTRIRNVDIKGFEIRMQEQESRPPVHGTETIAYVAWEPSAGSVANQHFEVSRTTYAVTHQFYPVSFQETFTILPVLLADMQTTNGSDTANLRWRNKGFGSVEVGISEEQSKDSETAHTHEVVGYMLFEPVN